MFLEFVLGMTKYNLARTTSLGNFNDNNMQLVYERSLGVGAAYYSNNILLYSLDSFLITRCNHICPACYTAGSPSRLVPEQSSRRTIQGDMGSHGNIGKGMIEYTHSHMAEHIT